MGRKRILGIIAALLLGLFSPLAQTSHVHAADPNTPPTGSISINNGAAYTTSSNVTLNLTASDPDGNSMEMAFSNDNVTWSSWESYASTKAWTLSTGDGSKTVYYQLRDSALETSPIYSYTIIVDTMPPVIMGVSQGGIYKADITIDFNEGTATLNGAAFTSGSTVTAEGAFTLIVTDAAGNFTTINFTIDKTPPTITGVTNDGFYNANRTITFNEGTATMNGAAFTSGSTVSSEGTYTLIVADEAGNVTTVNFTIDKTPPIVTGVTHGTVYTSPVTISFNEGTATLNGNTFTSGTTVSAFGKYSLVVTDDAGNSTSIPFTLRSASSGGGGGGSSGSGGGDSSGSGGGNSIPLNTIDIQINNVVFKRFATASVNTVSGEKVTTVQLDVPKIQQELESLRDQSTIVIPVQNGSNRVSVLLNGQLVKILNDFNTTVEVQTDHASYTLTANQFDMNEIARRLGSDTSLDDVQFNIEIMNVPDNKVDLLRNGLGTINLVSPAIEFKITASFGGKTIEIDQFLHFVQRRIVIPDGIDPNKITTGVVVAEDGSIVPVPTRLVKENGNYNAVINSLTNSTYVVVSHSLYFADMEQHWAKDAVNDLGSRLVVSGISETSFNPDADITRAEFAAIIVRGLGLRQGIGANPFLDVESDAWYEGAVRTAVSYGLITGFEDGTFRPNEKITREQTMLIVAKAMKLTGLALETGDDDPSLVLKPFTDSASIDAWAKDAVALVVKSGLIKGRDGKLESESYITRAEVAAIIQRLLEKSDFI